jgi:energy-converting hydrogenase Eha subunit E
MISRDRIEPAIAAGVKEWHRGRESDPTLAPRGVPDLSVVPGYSLDDVRYNCVGLQSPAQSRQAKKTLLLELVGIGVGVAFVAFTLAQGAGLFTFIALIFIGVGGLKTVLLLQDIWTGHLSQVDGDIWTELKSDSEGPDHFFVHIDDLRLEITKQAYGALKAGGPYRIYYLPDAKRAVGGQVLPAWRPLCPPATKKRSWWSRVSIEV